MRPQKTSHFHNTSEHGDRDSALRRKRRYTRWDTRWENLLINLEKSTEEYTLCIKTNPYYFFNILIVSASTNSCIKIDSGCVRYFFHSPLTNNFIG